jgi:8-oxo-dGTP pyrophosphatase MutT (NUDIX family)
MNFQLFIQKLKDQMEQPLPGEVAQLKMAPAQRLAYMEYFNAGLKDSNQSAVLICLYPHLNSIYTVLMLRPSEQGAHSDQVSFPGGKFEDGDGSLEATALREAQEEVGIEPSSLVMIGKLTPVYIPVSNYLVHPFIAASFIRPDFSMNTREVKQIIETEITPFLNEAIKSHGIFNSGLRVEIEAPFYEIQKHKIWGATAMILSELETILQNFFPFA